MRKVADGVTNVRKRTCRGRGTKTDLQRWKCEYGRMEQHDLLGKICSPDFSKSGTPEVDIETRCMRAGKIEGVRRYLRVSRCVYEIPRVMFDIVVGRLQIVCGLQKSHINRQCFSPTAGGPF